MFLKRQTVLSIGTIPFVEKKKKMRELRKIRDFTSFDELKVPESTDEESQGMRRRDDLYKFCI